MSNGNYGTIVDPDDMFKDTRMSFGDHLEDLRTHLWRAVKGFLLAMILALCFGNHVVKFIAAPVEQQLGVFYERVAQKKALEESAASKDINYHAERVGLTVRFNVNQMRQKLRLPTEPEPILGPTVKAFERMLEKADAAYLIDRENL